MLNEKHWKDIVRDILNQDPSGKLGPRDFHTLYDSYLLSEALNNNDLSLAKEGAHILLKYLNQENQKFDKELHNYLYNLAIELLNYN